LEITISQEAHKLDTKSGKKFSDILGNSIAEYIQEKDLMEELSQNSSKRIPTEVADILEKLVFICFSNITKAYSNGLVSQGSNLLEKIDDCRKRNAELMKDLAICMANYTALQNEHTRLLKMFDQNQNEEWTKQEKENEQR
jgi:galactokinase/mevalonate kinase-like predicted kinase